jgi:hypothetical protein
MSFNEKMDRQKVKRLLEELLLNKGSSKENLKQLAEEIYPGIERDLFIQSIESEIDQYFRELKGMVVDEIVDERDFITVFIDAEMRTLVPYHEGLNKFFNQLGVKYKTDISLMYRTLQWINHKELTEDPDTVPSTESTDPTFAVELN